MDGNAPLFGGLSWTHILERWRYLLVRVSDPFTNWTQGPKIIFNNCFKLFLMIRSIYIYIYDSFPPFSVIFYLIYIFKSYAKQVSIKKKVIFATAISNINHIRKNSLEKNLSRKVHEEKKNATSTAAIPDGLFMD